MTKPPELENALRARLASGMLVIRNAAITIGARGVMVLIAVLAVPILIDRLGTPRFGILALAWIVIGYANVFDLGLGRALTRFTAERIGAGRTDEIPTLFWTAIGMLAFLGVVAGSLLLGFSGVLTANVLEIPPSLQPEARVTFALLGCTIPFVLVSAALKGSLEARQRFDLTNAVAVPLSMLSYFGPVAMSFVTRDLPLVISTVVASRVFATAINLYLCLRVDPTLRGDREFDRSKIAPLLRFGGWVTVAAIVTPLMLTFDRFLIGAMVSTVAVAYYATPYEAAKQLLLVSSSFSTVLFPGFSASVRRDPKGTEKLFRIGTRATFIGLFPLTLIASVLSYELLNIWIDQEFATQGGPVLQLLAAGILVNGLAFIAYALIQSTRPDLIAKVACVELPIYLGTLWLLLQAYGIRGAAIAFVIRVTADTLVLYWLSHRLRLVGVSALMPVFRLAALGVAAIAVGSQIPDSVLRLAYVVIALASFIPLAWRRILADDERQRLLAAIGRLRSRLQARDRSAIPATPTSTE